MWREEIGGPGSRGDAGEAGDGVEDGALEAEELVRRALERGEHRALRVWRINASSSERLPELQNAEELRTHLGHRRPVGHLLLHAHIGGKDLRPRFFNCADQFGSRPKLWGCT